MLNLMLMFICVDVICGMVSIVSVVVFVIYSILC